MEGEKKKWVVMRSLAPTRKPHYGAIKHILWFHTTLLGLFLCIAFQLHPDNDVSLIIFKDLSRCYNAPEYPTFLAYARHSMAIYNAKNIPRNFF